MQIRKHKPNYMAVINESCTGCGGSPICETECPVEGCMTLVQNPYAPVYKIIDVDPLTCIGCSKCISRGPNNTLLKGCPWDAIDMVPIQDWESENGVLPY